MGDIPIPSDWTGEYCRYAICWPKSREWLAILRGLCFLPATGRFYLDSGGSIIGAQEVIRDTLDYNFKQQEVIMACGDGELTDIADAIRALALATTNSAEITSAAGCGCGQGSAGGGAFDAPPSPNEQGNPETDPPPDGYDSWEQFDIQKCGAAWYLIDNLKQSLINVGYLTVSGLSVEAVVELILVALTLTVSSAGIAAIAALVLTIVGTIVIATALSLINEHEEELVCALLNGTDSISSRAGFLAKFNQIVDDAAIDPVEGFAMKQLIAYLVEIGEVNLLYDAAPNIDWEAVSNGRDCSGCTPICWFFDEDLEDWTVGPIPEPGGGCDTFPAQGTMSWEDGDMVMTPTSSAGSYYVSALSPEFEYEVQSGDFFCFEIVEVDDATYVERIQMTIDGVCVQVYAVGAALHEGAFTFFLTDYVGQTITRIELTFILASSFSPIHISSIGINCPACEE